MYGNLCVWQIILWNFRTKPGFAIFLIEFSFAVLCVIILLMENVEKQWSVEKAEKHLKISSVLIVLGGVAGLIMAIDDFVSLGKRLSTFILPYLYNITAIGISLFQIYLGIAWLKKKLWSKYAVFSVITIRFMFCFFDYAEVLQAIILLIYLSYIMGATKMGVLFKKKTY